MGSQLRTTQISSIGLRISAILFFRFVSAHLPSIVFTLFAIYAPVFIYTYFFKPELVIIDDEINVVVKETVVTEEATNGDITTDAKELDIQETVTYGEPIVPLWKIIFYGTPNTRYPIASLVGFIINLIFVTLTADALYRARFFYPAQDLSFARLGYVSHAEARLFIREPNQAVFPLNIQVRSAASDTAIEDAAWNTIDSIAGTVEESDFTTAITIPLRSSQQMVYQWRTSNNLTGQFVSAPRPGSMPTQNNGKFTFLSTSCILPRFPYNPLDHPLAIPGLRHLAKRLPNIGAQFMLFLGDFIYVDVPQRFGKSIDQYRMQYRQVYASPEWASVGQNLSWIHVLDDHEISNDWSSKNAGVYNNAMEPFNLYQASVNPPQAIQAGSSALRRKHATWFEFVQGPASFFMLDTRSFRSDNGEPFNNENKTMLGGDQLEDFLAWLARPEPKGVKWKIIASSVPFTKNWPVNVRDTWGGFLFERRKILEAMWDASSRGQGVIILSGDRHEFAVTKFPPPADSKWPQSAAPHEISTSPLNQFASPLPTYKQVDGEDVKIKYIPSGTSKFGSFTIEDEDGESSLSYQLYIDGKPTWNMTLHTTPKEPTTGSFWDKLWS
ncbi:hypothetical protein VHEMI00978 [[Torrubiella] hemipterigena]|uniref:PhoD-like phosphatase metallophosphatase domain-containing protein n=1 Tax=[Torrubiella] hemipterigena TaxID=1531966 RepID=A0A0A1SKQ0_9HYPO|nr:hypothetical protein VHEMI00978 [[Torrubiella] hemipterigena]